VENLLKNADKLNQMKIAAQKFYKPDAAQRIAQNILSLIPRFMVSLAEPPK